MQVGERRSGGTGSGGGGVPSAGRAQFARRRRETSAHVGRTRRQTLNTRYLPPLSVRNTHNGSCQTLMKIGNKIHELPTLKRCLDVSTVQQAGFSVTFPLPEWLVKWESSFVPKSKGEPKTQSDGSQKAKCQISGPRVWTNKPLVPPNQNKTARLGCVVKHSADNWYS